MKSVCFTGISVLVGRNTRVLGTFDLEGTFSGECIFRFKIKIGVTAKLEVSFRIRGMLAG